MQCYPTASLLLIVLVMTSFGIATPAWSGLASGQVEAGYSNNIQLQPPYHQSDQDQHRWQWNAQCSNECNCVREHHITSTHRPLRKLHWLLHWLFQQHPCWSWSGLWYSGCRCILLLHPASICLDAGPALGMLIVWSGCCVGKWWSSLMSDITAVESDG